MVEIKYYYQEVKQEEIKCTKPDCHFCRLTKDNEGRASEEALIKLGLATKEKLTF